MHKTSKSSSSTTDARAACYATGLTNANLFQTDFAAIERRQSLVLQRRPAVWKALAHHFQESADMARAIYRTMHQHGPLRGLRPTLLLIKQDLEARL